VQEGDGLSDALEHLDLAGKLAVIGIDIDKEEDLLLPPKPALQIELPMGKPLQHVEPVSGELLKALFNFFIYGVFGYLV
jgi:hypothetical protein